MKELETSKLFHSITEGELERILKCSKSRIKKYPQGSYIFEQEGLPTKLFLLLEGQVQICKDFTSGKRDVLYLVEEGNVFGEIFLFGDRRHYWYDAVASKDVTVLEVPWDLQTVFLLDRIQKGLPVEKEDVDRLRSQKLVEGRLTSLYLSASAAKSIDESTSYIKNKGFDDKYYKDLIVEYLKQYGKAKKKNIRELLWDKLPDALSDVQKENKICNMLTMLKKQGIIDKDSENQQKSNWILK